MFLRYDERLILHTKRDPLDDLICWIEGLRSLGYTRDLLAERHGFQGAATNREAALAIRAHVDPALHLIEQAQASTPDVAFLPLYYAVLNLAKIYVVLAGQAADLGAQRWHGATYSGLKKTSQDLLTDTISLKEKGAIPLFYRAITGTGLPRSNLTLKMGELYPYIQNVSHEFHRCYQAKPMLAPLEIGIEQPAAGEHRLFAALHSAAPTTPMKHQLKVLAGFKADPTRKNVWVSPSIAGDEKATTPKLLQNARRYLFYSTEDHAGQLRTLTPISGRQLLLPEEIPLILVFFHLSNVVRYNPEFLAKLRDSRAWTILLVLREHASLAFLELFWSRMTKIVHGIRR